MSLVFKTPKSTLNTTSKAIQNLGGDCPPCPEPVVESTSEEFIRNGEYTLIPKEGVDGFSQVDITVNIPSDVNNQNKTVSPSTSSQTVEADSGYSGLGTVTVNAVTSAIDANIQAENILDGVTILGVTGTDLGYQAGYDEGEAAGETAGYQSGYEAGYEQGQSECPEPTLSNLNITPSTNAQEYNPAISGVDGYSLVSVSAVTSAIDQNITAGNIKNGVSILGVTGSYNPQPRLQSKDDINPTTSIQGVSPDPGYDGLSYVGINGVTAAIDNNIQAGNIKSGVTILGVTGNYNPQPNLQSKSVNPTTSAQTVSPDSGYDGLSQVSVAAVTSAIDANIAASNIKNGVSILGVTGNVVEAIYDSNNEFLSDVTGRYTIDPSTGKNAFSNFEVTVDANPIGSFWNPFEVVEQTAMADVYNKLDEGGYFDGMSAFFCMDVESGSIDSETGYYIAEDANGNSFAIEPYFENPDYDPENPDPNVPQLIFPENFDLSGLSIQVDADFANVTITENEPEDPNLVPTYTVEISQCVLSGINWNSDMESWPLYWGGGLSGGIETSTRNLHLSTNEPQVMSLSSSEPWEIELDQPEVQSQMNIRPLTKSGLRSAAPTLEISQMSGDAGVFTLNVLSKSDQATGFTVRGLNSGNEVYVAVNSIGDYFTIESLADNNDVTIEYKTDYADGTHRTVDLSYSVDSGETWSPVNWSSNTGYASETITLNEGETVLFKGNNLRTYAIVDDSGRQGRLHFISSDNVNISGNICSLLKSENFANYSLEVSQAFRQLFSKDNYSFLHIVNADGLVLPSSISSYCFYDMFNGCTTLETAPVLPALFIPSYAYYAMFRDCTSLTAAPELPATIVDSYAYTSMFNGCTTIESAPLLPAKELSSHCYQYMFMNCTSLSSIDSGSSYGIVGAAENCCDAMFQGCTALTNVPTDLLPATRVYTECYRNMFQGCTSLENAPDLPTKGSLSVGSGAARCYASMFSGCSSLQAAPVLPASTPYIGSYQYMFNNCSLIDEVTCLATSVSSNGCITGWLNGTAASGTLYKDPNMEGWVVGTNVPSGWTIEDYVEE